MNRPRICIYKADCFCDACGQKIARELRDSGLAPKEPENLSSYDSDSYPKWVEDNWSHDCPYHCAAGKDCVEAIHVPKIGKVGCILTERLSKDGIVYVEEALREGGLIAELWRSTFIGQVDTSIGLKRKRKSR